jgi:cell division cycle 2-like protein
VLALKKVKMEKEKEGFPLTSIREINILLSLDHPNIIDVTEVRKGEYRTDGFWSIELTSGLCSA